MELKNINLSENQIVGSSGRVGKQGSIKVGTKGTVIGKVNGKYLIKIDDEYTLLSEAFLKGTEEENIVEITKIYGTNQSMNCIFDHEGNLLRDGKLHEKNVEAVKKILESVKKAKEEEEAKAKEQANGKKK